MPTPVLLPSDGPPPSGAAVAHALAWRLHLKHRDASDRLLEALAAADWTRAVNGRLVLAVPPNLPAGPAWERCLAAAEAAVAGHLGPAPAGAEMYHRRGAAPPWAAGFSPVAEVADFLFYRLTE